MQLDKAKYEKILKMYNEHKDIPRSKRIFYKEIGYRRTGIQYMYSRDELSEYTKCALDIFYFIDNYTDFKLRDYQKKIINNFKDGAYNIYNKSCQIGFNTVYALIYLHEMLFNNNLTILYVCNRSDDGFKFLNIIKKWYKKLPLFLKPGIVNFNTKTIVLENRSRIKVSIRPKEPVVGYTIDYLHIDSAAHILQPIFNMFYRHIIPVMTCMAKSKITIASEPNGHNHFYELCRNAKRKENDPLKNIYTYHEIYYWEVEGRDQSWVDEQINIYGLNLFRQLYDCEFYI